MPEGFWQITSSLKDTTFSERPLDLSDLAFKDSLLSKILYGLLLSSSFVSAGTSFARVLKWGRNPVITTFLSIRFFKIILLIVTRFCILAITLRTAVRSLMFQYVISGMMEEGPGKELFFEVMSFSYRGLCTKRKGIHYCTKFEILTFDQATLYAPLIQISLIFCLLSSWFSAAV